VGKVGYMWVYGGIYPKRKSFSFTHPPGNNGLFNFLFNIILIIRQIIEKVFIATALL